MTDAEFRTQKARVMKAFTRWERPTGMTSWIVSHTWHRDGTAGESKATRDGFTTSARASVAWEYLNVGFHWNLEHLSDNNDHELDRIVRHEICHALVQEMRCWGPPTMPQEKCDEALQHEERVVTQLASVLLWCAESGNKRIAAKKKGKGK